MRIIGESRGNVTTDEIEVRTLVGGPRGATNGRAFHETPWVVQWPLPLAPPGFLPGMPDCVDFCSSSLLAPGVGFCVGVAP